MPPVAVENLAAPISFCSTLFGAEPAVLKSDYAKWMLEDPPAADAAAARQGKCGR